MKLSMLVPVRPNSVLLAKFLTNFFTYTNDLENTELILMVSKKDTWNKDLLEYFKDKVKILYEDYGFGQTGHHIYINEMANIATGDWFLGFCDDMEIILKGWDDEIRKYIEKNELDHKKVYAIVPPFDPPGALEFVQSRGYLEAVGRLFGYPNGDSWVGTVMGRLAQMGENRVLYMHEPFMFIDHTRDLDYQPLFHFRHIPPTAKSWKFGWGTPEVFQMCEAEAIKLLEAIQNGK